MKKLILASLIAAVLSGCNSDDAASNNTDGNSTPDVADIPTLSLAQDVQGDFYSYQIEVNEQAGEALSFELESNPEWIVIDAQTGVITVDLIASTIGTFDFTVLISNGETQTRRSVKLHVAAYSQDLDNPTPSITALPVIEVQTYEESRFQVVAHDPDDTLTYRLLDAPDFLTINPNSGLLAINAQKGDEGEVDFTVNVSDGNSEASSVGKLRVSKSINTDNPDLENAAPLVDEIAPINAKTGQTASLRIHARDLDNDPLTYRLKDASTWVKIDAITGLIVVTPDETHVGEHQFSALVSDGKIEVVRDFSVNVELTLVTPTNFAPEIALIPVLEAATEQVSTYRVNAYDTNGDVLSFKISDNPGFVRIDTQSGLLTLSPTVWDDGGEYTFLLSVSDGELTSTREVTVQLSASGTSSDPVVRAMLAGDHQLATEAQLLAYAAKKIDDEIKQSQAMIDVLYEGVESVTWNPTHDSMYIRNYNKHNNNTAFLTGNRNHSGAEVKANLGIVGEQPSGQRYAFMTGDPFAVYGDAGMDKLLKNLLSWVTHTDVRETINIVVAQYPNSGYFVHYNALIAWLEANYPDAYTINDYTECDNEALLGCIDERKPDVVLFSNNSFVNGDKGMQVVYDEMKAKKVPWIFASTFRDPDVAMMPFLNDIGITSIDTNYWQKYRLEGATKEDILLADDPRVGVIEKFQQGAFSSAPLSGCSDNYLSCSSDAFEEEFKYGADALRNDIFYFDSQGIDIFSTKDAELPKVSLLLADKYRAAIDYPISTSETMSWYQAMFADWIVSYARDDNKAQADLGEYIVPTDQVVKGDNAHYAYPDTVTRSQTSSVPFSNQWTTSGWYALPGIPLTLTRTGEDTHDVIVQLHYARAKTNRAYETHTYTKPLELTTARIKIPAQGSVTLSTPYGAAIYFDHRSNEANVALSSEITATGVAEHPAITDFSDAEQITRFESLLDSTQLPHIDLKMQGAELHLRRDKFVGAIGDTYPTTADLLHGIKQEHLETVYSLAAFKIAGKTLAESVSPSAMALCNATFGAGDCNDENLHIRKNIQHANYDQYAQCGAGCSGNPWDSSGSISPRGWLDNHELGHNLQAGRLGVGYVTQENRNNWAQYSYRANENSNNIFPYYVMWKSHYIDSQSSTEISDSHTNSKDIFYAFQSDAAGLVNASNERVIYTPSCSLLATGSTREEAIWSGNGYAQNNSYRMNFYIQMALRADGLAQMADGSKLGTGFDIYPLLYMHERIFSRYVSNADTWLANRERLGFELFEFSGVNGAISSITGNDFMLVSLSHLTGYDWSAHFALYGLRNSDLAKQQASVNGINGALPMGMYVLDTNLPPLAITDELTFLPLSSETPDTLWPRDNSSPVNCAQ